MISSLTCYLSVSVDCSAVICPVVDCLPGYVNYVPEGECCSQCKSGMFTKYMQHTHTRARAHTTRTHTYTHQFRLLSVHLLNRKQYETTCKHFLYLVTELNKKNSVE